MENPIETELKKKAEEQLEKAIKRVPQLSSAELKNRFSFHPATNKETQNKHEAIRLWALEFAEHINSQVPEGREKVLAITHLEEVMMWANAGIARND